MKRRALLATVSGAALFAAGCVGGVPGSDDLEPGNGEELDASIETTGSDCADPDDDWAVAGADDDVVVIDGLTPSPNPCHAATIEAVSVDDGALAIEIGVESTLEADEECIECAGAVAYTATIEGLETTITAVTVDHHEGETHDLEPYDRDADPSVVSSDIETIDVTPGDEDRADAVIRGPVIDVNGVIPAPTPCHVAILDDVRIADAVLEIDVGVEEDPEAGDACSQVISSVEYLVTIEISGPPIVSEVRVAHADGSTHTLTDEGEG